MTKIRKIDKIAGTRCVFCCCRFKSMCVCVKIGENERARLCVVVSFFKGSSRERVFLQGRRAHLAAPPQIW